MEEVKRVNGFPSDFLSPETKASKEYSLKWAETMDKVGLNSSSNGFFPGFLPGTQLNKFAIWRSYARANQSIDKYKPQLGVRKKTHNDPNATSYRVLNWEILDIYSKFVNVLIGKLLEQNNDIGINAIDKRAQDARRKKEIELQDEAINGTFYDSITAKTGIKFERPVHEDVVPPPSSLGEIGMFMGQFYKEDYCLIVQDLIKEINEQDNYNYILSEVARDLVEIGVAVTKTYRVGNKILRRKCNPERMGISSSTKSNFEDIKFIYEDWDLTIGQLKEIAGAQLSEDEYKEIAETQMGRNIFTDINVPEYFQQNLCYPWDSTKVTVKDCVWFSPDWMTEQIATNSFGNTEVQQKEYDWWRKLEAKGVTTDSFNKANASKVNRYCLDNQYQCLWIKGTKHVINFGKSKDMLKNSSSIGKTVGPYTVYQMKKCTTESVLPVVDNIQINWMQYQHHIAKSTPAGPAIEFTALQDISIEGASGKKLTPKQALQIYWETGTLLWRRRDAAGNLSNFKPIEEMKGGISNAAERHFQFIIQDINLLRGQIGLNELTDASTPNSEMGKTVATMASGATDDALRPLHFAFDEINKGTTQRTVMHITGMARTGLAPYYTEAIGLRGMSLLKFLSDLTEHELGCYLEKAPTQEEAQWIAKYCDSGIKAGSLFEEEALEIQKEPNPYRKIKLLKMYRQQKRDMAMKDEETKAQIKSQNDTATAQAAAQASMDATEVNNESEKEKAWEVAKAKVWAEGQLVAHKAFLLNLKSKNARGEAYSAEEQARITKMMEIDRTGAWDLRISKAKPKPKPAAK